MSLQEPKIEFVPIDGNAFVQTANSCPEAAIQNVTGGGQRCIGTQPEAADCADWDTSIPYSTEG